jgi:hypothetical protein
MLSNESLNHNLEAPLLIAKVISQLSLDDYATLTVPKGWSSCFSNFRSHIELLHFAEN